MLGLLSMLLQDCRCLMKIDRRQSCHSQTSSQGLTLQQRTLALLLLLLLDSDNACRFGLS
jgi:hypothetical protein